MQLNQDTRNKIKEYATLISESGKVIRIYKGNVSEGEDASAQNHPFLQTVNKMQQQFGHLLAVDAVKQLSNKRFEIGKTNFDAVDTKEIEAHLAELDKLKKDFDQQLSGTQNPEAMASIRMMLETQRQTQAEMAKPSPLTLEREKSMEQAKRDAAEIREHLKAAGKTSSGLPSKHLQSEGSLSSQVKSKPTDSTPDKEQKTTQTPKKR